MGENLRSYHAVHTVFFEKFREINFITSGSFIIGFFALYESRFLLFPQFLNCALPLVVENDALYFFYFLVHQKETSVKNGVLWKFLFSIHHHELNKILYFGIDTKSIGALQEIF